MSLKELITKWEAENEELKPLTKSGGKTFPSNAILAHQIKQNCINDLKAYQSEALKNGSINH